MKTLNIYLAILFFVIISCEKKNEAKIIVVKNTLNIERTFETIELTKDFLKVDSLVNIGIENVSTGTLIITQLVDVDGDGNFDQLLFQPTIAPNSEERFEVVLVAENDKPKSSNNCYSRFVPERTDDYAWENDKVAFRVYGPTAQKMIENNIKGGTLSSGVDAWLKKVEYPIINKWYKETLVDKTGSYHEDTGEGLDNFHVGVSRGVGGIAVKNDNNYYFSKNYTKWNTITTGPIRTSFYLEYEDWDANGNVIKESKTISLDLGNNLSKFDLNIQGTNLISAGLTLHEKDGEVTGSNKNGWVNYWQPHFDSEIETAVVAKQEYFKGFEKYDTPEKDLSNAYANLNVINGKVVYYAGFTWKESLQFKTRKDWINYLNVFSKKINNPLIVELIK